MCGKRILTLLIAVIVTSTCFADTVFVYSTIVIPDSVLVKSLNVGAVKHPFWDNLPIIITAFITLSMGIASLFVAYINTQNSIKAKMKTLQSNLKHKKKI